MTLSIWISYTIACILIITSPGPTVTYLITTSMTHGKKNSLPYRLGKLLGWPALFDSLIYRTRGLTKNVRNTVHYLTTTRLLLPDLSRD